MTTKHNIYILPLLLLLLLAVRMPELPHTPILPVLFSDSAANGFLFSPMAPTPSLLYHGTNSVVLEQMAGEKNPTLSPKSCLILRGIYPFGGSLTPQLIDHNRDCSWDRVHVCDSVVGAAKYARKRFVREPTLNTVILRPEDFRSFLGMESAFLEEVQQNGNLASLLRVAVEQMKLYHLNLKRIFSEAFHKSILQNYARIMNAQPVVFGFNMLQDLSRLQPGITGEYSIGGVIQPCNELLTMARVQEVYCADDKETMALLEKLGLKAKRKANLTLS